MNECNNRRHYTHEGIQNISEAKWQHQPLIKTVPCIEYRFPFITWSDEDLMVFALEINLQKDTSLEQHVYHNI